MAEMVKTCVNENATSALSQEGYTKKYNALVKRYEETESQLDELSTEKSRNKNVTVYSGFLLKY